MAQTRLKLVSGGGAEATSPRRRLIEVDRLTKTYRTRDGDVPSLKPIDLAIREGEFVAVVGPSGCGKSTLLKLMAGLIPPTSGEIRIDGKPVKEPPDDVGIVFQSPVLLAWRTVIRNVMMPVEVRRLEKPEDPFDLRRHFIRNLRRDDPHALRARGEQPLRFPHRHLSAADDYGKAVAHVQHHRIGVRHSRPILSERHVGGELAGGSGSPSNVAPGIAGGAQ